LHNRSHNDQITSIAINTAVLQILKVKPASFARQPSHFNSFQTSGDYGCSSSQEQPPRQQQQAHQDYDHGLKQASKRSWAGHVCPQPMDSGKERALGQDG
jgi:hypothetical protein